MEDLIQRVTTLTYFDGEKAFREIDAEIAWVTKWRWEGWLEGDVQIETYSLKSVLDRVNRRSFNSVWEHIPKYTTSIDAALTLGKEFPWLCQTIQYHDQTVRLVNGLGLPIRGNDWITRANLVPCALTAAWLKVISEKTNG